MRLSEAIRLGSLLVEEPTRGRLYGCALGMGMRACGVLPRKIYLHDFDSVGQDDIFGPIAIWPWLGMSVGDYSYALYWRVVADLFDNQVMQGELTLEALCGLVRTWEDELAAKGVNVEQVTMAATPETTHEPAPEHIPEVEVVGGGA